MAQSQKGMVTQVLFIALQQISGSYMQKFSLISNTEYFIGLSAFPVIHAHFTYISRSM